jgi:hypothetical protein
MFNRSPTVKGVPGLTDVVSDTSRASTGPLRTTCPMPAASGRRRKRVESTSIEAFQRLSGILLVRMWHNQLIISYFDNNI